MSPLCVHGPFDLVVGLRFNPDRLRLDPYAPSVVVPASHNRDLARLDADNTAMAMKSLIVNPDTHDCDGDTLRLVAVWSCCRSNFGSPSEKTDGMTAATTNALRPRFGKMSSDFLSSTSPVEAMEV
jgi:hypothetical protein